MYVFSLDFGKLFCLSYVQEEALILGGRGGTPFLNIPNVIIPLITNIS